MAGIPSEYLSSPEFAGDFFYNSTALRAASAVGGGYVPPNGVNPVNEILLAESVISQMPENNVLIDPVEPNYNVLYSADPVNPVSIQTGQEVMSLGPTAPNLTTAANAVGAAGAGGISLNSPIVIGAAILAVALLSARFGV